MSAEPAATLNMGNIDSIGQALIDHCGLSVQNIEQIVAAAKAGRMSFSEAAMHTGLVTPERLEEVIKRVGRAEARTGGVIEAALLRQSESRSLVLRHAGEVAASRRLILAHDPDHPRGEQIRALRTALMLLNESSKQANVLAVLSPNAKEGRSQVAADLAIAFSQLGRRTLLVDADLRKPSQHQLFGAWEYSGLVQALSSGKSPQLLAVAGLPNLSLMTAGQSSPNPLEMLSDGRFQRLLGDWRRQYDFIIIDTPPVSEFSDALAIATLAGRVLICSRVAVTPHASMKVMMRRLENTQARVLGAVMNKF